MYKQLGKQVLRGKIFIFLLLLLTFLTSLSFFFVRFSIDGNLENLQNASMLSADQIRYHTALESNISLAYTFLLSMSGLSSFIFILFFYRFFRANRKQLGCIKALGFSDNEISIFFLHFTAIISLVGALPGIWAGYCMSDILIRANMQSYNVDHLVKSVYPSTLLIGIGATTLAYVLISLLCTFMIRGKEIGALITGQTQNNRFSVLLKISDKIVSILPIKNKFPLRIALRKPVAVLLIFAAVMSFSICMIISRSLNLSCQQVYESQIQGRQYAFEVLYPEYQYDLPEGSDHIAYLKQKGLLITDKYELEQNIVAIHHYNELFVFDAQGIPRYGEMIIGPGLADVYGLDKSDVAEIRVNDQSMTLTVIDIAHNAESNTLYIHIDALTEMLGTEESAYNGLFAESLYTLTQIYMNDDTIVVSEEERLDHLEREAVSNNTSAVINQVIGAVVGCVLIFLALYINFLDNTRDMLILHMMGHKIKTIRKTLIDVYLPIVWISFFASLYPAIVIVRSIHRSLSITTKDYIPFTIDPLSLVIFFIILNILYLLVQSIFALFIKRIIAKENITEYTAFE